MNGFLTLLRKDFKQFFRHRGEVALAFLIPIIMGAVFGLIFGRNSNDAATPAITVAWVDLDHSALSKRLLYEMAKESSIKLIDSLKFENKLQPVDSTNAISTIRRGKFGVALVVPRGAFQTLVDSGRIKLEMWNDPKSAIETNITAGMTERAVFSGIPELLGTTMMNSLGNSESVKSFQNDLQKLVATSYHINLDTLKSSWWNGSDRSQLEEMLLRPINSSTTKTDSTQQSTSVNPFGKMFDFHIRNIVGEEISNPGIAQSIAGTAVLFILFSIGAGAQLLLKEQRAGTLRRILIAGVSIRTLLFEKWTYLVLLGLLQLYAMFLFGSLVFGLEIGRAPLELLLISFSTVAAMSGVALLIAAIAKTEEAASGIVTVVALTMSALGGSMIPSFIMPPFLQLIGKFTINGWAMEAFLNYFWRRLPLSDSFLAMGIMFGVAVITSSISLRILSKRLK